MIVTIATAVTIAETAVTATTIKNSISNDIKGKGE